MSSKVPQGIRSIRTIPSILSRSAQLATLIHQLREKPPPQLQSSLRSCHTPASWERGDRRTFTLPTFTDQQGTCTSYFLRTVVE